jgi:hypothetical protein
VNIRLWSDSQCLKQYLEQVDEEGLASVAEVDRLQRKHSSYTPTSGLAQHPSSAASMPASSAALPPSSPLAPLGASFLVPAKPIIFHPNVTMKCKKYQNYTWIDLCSLLPIQKFWSQTLIRLSHWLQILPNPSQRYDSSSEILRFINIVRDRLCETFSIFYHGLHVWYHEILTNLMIFRLRLLFLEFKNHSATRLWSCFLNKIFEISFDFPGKASHRAQ